MDLKACLKIKKNALSLRTRAEGRGEAIYTLDCFVVLPEARGLLTMTVSFIVIVK